MAKSKSSKTNCWPHEIQTPKAPEKFKDRNLMKVNPLNEQFAPTDAVPIRSNNRMGGYDK